MTSTTSSGLVEKMLGNKNHRTEKLALQMSFCKGLT
jgi:hypothetical protein